MKRILMDSPFPKSEKWDSDIITIPANKKAVYIAGNIVKNSYSNKRKESKC